MRFVIMGASKSAGIGKESGKKYDINTLLLGRSVREWENDKGKCIGFGYQITEMPFEPSPEFLKKLDSTPFPIVGELVTQLNPDNPKENIALDFNVCWSIWDANPENKK